MYAEFDAVKIKLGELKDIEEGLVVDLTSLYDNKVTLKVEGKPIASGSLVIINDRYGVKVDNVIAQTGGVSSSGQTFENSEEDYSQNQNPEDEYENSGSEEQGEDSLPQGEEDEEFDYSDFELEDENI